MKKKRNVKRKIYIRTLAALCAAYLVLMTGFSIFHINQQKRIENMNLLAYLYQVNNSTDSIMEGNWDDNHQIINMGKVREGFLDKMIYVDSKTDLAFYSEDYEVIYRPKNFWRCTYTKKQVGNTFYTGYASFDPDAWFKNKDKIEFESYLYTDFRPKKKGELSSYTIKLEGFWLDEGMVIPNKISVLPMYASDFDEKGRVTSSTGAEKGKIIFTSNYKNTDNLPYFSSGYIINENSYSQDRVSIQNMSLVLDKDKLQKSIEKKQLNSIVRQNGLKYRFYQITGYKNNINVDESNQYSSELWTVAAREVNLWDNCKATLLLVWGGSLLLFAAAALFISAQSYGLYKKREELDCYRIETTNALAHDLKTPLSIISGYAQNLQENIQTEKRVYYAGNICKNVERMDRIIGEMLELSRLENGGTQINNEEVSLQEVCNKIINRYLPVCEERSIITEIEGEAVVKAEFRGIERILDNFFTNALNHTDNGGSICIHIIDNTLEFFNSGSYIAEDEMQEVWKPFKKTDKARSSTKGTGLGLSIAAKLLELYGFTYGISNKESGVVFWFRW